MRKLRVGFVFALCSVALMACTRLITEELPTHPAGPANPGGTTVPTNPTPTPVVILTPVPSATPTVIPTPTPKPTPTPAVTPDPTTTECVPAPPPLARINVKIHNDQGEKKVIDSAPNVCSGGPGFETYCETIMKDPTRRCCPVRPEGHPQREACEAMLMGQARDTGRVGPTWTMNGKPCVDTDSTVLPRCVNHPNNQYLLFIYGKGTVKACAENGYCGEVVVQ